MCDGKAPDAIGDDLHRDLLRLWTATVQRAVVCPMCQSRPMKFHRRKPRIPPVRYRLPLQHREVLLELGPERRWAEAGQSAVMESGLAAARRHGPQCRRPVTADGAARVPVRCCGALHRPTSAACRGPAPRCHQIRRPAMAVLSETPSLTLGGRAH